MGIILLPDTGWVKTALPISTMAWGLQQSKWLERCKRRRALESIFSPCSAPTTSSRQYCLIRQNFWRTGKGKGLFWGFQQWCEIQISFNSSWLAQVLIDFAARLPCAPSLPFPPPLHNVCPHCILSSFLSRQTLSQDLRASSSLFLPAPFTSWFLSSPLCLTCVFTAVSSLSLSVAHLRWHLCPASLILSGDSQPFLSHVCRLSVLLPAYHTGPANHLCYTAHQNRVWPYRQVKKQVIQKRHKMSCHLVIHKVVMKLSLQLYHLHTPHSLPPLADWFVS